MIRQLSDNTNLKLETSLSFYFLCVCPSYSIHVSVSRRLKKSGCILFLLSVCCRIHFFAENVLGRDAQYGTEIGAVISAAEKGKGEQRDVGVVGTQPPRCGHAHNYPPRAGAAAPISVLKLTFINGSKSSRAKEGCSKLPGLKCFSLLSLMWD